MKNLSFKAIALMLIFAIGLLVMSPFTPDSSADSYILYISVTVTECWDTSVTFPVLCSSPVTAVSLSTAPTHDTSAHTPSSVVFSYITSTRTTDSCSRGCDS